MKKKLKTILISIAICCLFIVMGGALMGDGSDYWLMTLNQPWYSPPLWGWYIIGGLYYLMCITLLYKTFTQPNSKDKKYVLGLTVAMMAGNEFWNYLFFGLASTFAGFIGLLPYIVLVGSLFKLLLKYDRHSAWVLFPYLLWLGYDIVWAYDIWIMNR